MNSFLPLMFTFLDPLKFYHIFMPSRYTECCRVHFCLLRPFQLLWYDRQKNYNTSGYDDSLAMAEVTLDLPLSDSNPYLFCNLTGLCQHYYP